MKCLTFGLWIGVAILLYVTCIYRYDLPSSIPDGSIQSAGENVLAFLREVANSPHLSNPTSDDLHGKVVFTDILGLMMVVYPEWVAMVMNFVTVLLVAATFVRGINWTHSQNSGSCFRNEVLLSA